MSTASMSLTGYDRYVAEQRASNSAMTLPGRGEETNMYFRGIPDSSGNTSYREVPYQMTVKNPTLLEKYKFASIRIQNRDSNDPEEDLVYYFMINPSAVTVSRQTLDGQSMTRAGWQTGVWGEGFVQITLTGTMGGAYLNGTDSSAEGEEGDVIFLTSKYEEATASSRKLDDLRRIFQNNGYWFEAEESFGPLSWTGQRRRISRHADVIVTIGNFVWSGMFDAMDIDKTADTPFTSYFDISFTAWREEYRSESDWPNPLSAGGYYGHSHESLFVEDAGDRNTASLLGSIDKINKLAESNQAKLNEVFEQGRKEIFAGPRYNGSGNTTPLFAPLKPSLFSSATTKFGGNNVND